MQKRSIKYDTKLIESNQKDILIAQLQAENLEIKMRLFGENSNQKRIKDLENKIVEINKEKANSEIELREDKVALESKYNKIFSEISELKLSKEKDIEKIKCLSEDIKSLNLFKESKTLEAEFMGKQIKDLKEALEKKDTLLQQSQESNQELSEYKLKARIELDRALKLCEQMNDVKKEDTQKLQQLENENYSLKQKLNEITNNIPFIYEKTNRAILDNEIKVQEHNVLTNKIEKLIATNEKMMNENAHLNLLNEQLKIELKRCSDYSTFGGLKKEEYLRMTKPLEDELKEKELKIESLMKDKSDLELYIEHLNNEIEMYKKLHNELTQTNNNLEEKVKELGSKFLNNSKREDDKKELEKNQKINFHLNRENDLLKNDIASLKKHISILETQNASVI